MSHYRAKPLDLIGFALIGLLAYCAFSVSFLLAPLAILGLFYLVLAATDRGNARNGDEPGIPSTTAGGSPAP